MGKDVGVLVEGLGATADAEPEAEAEAENEAVQAAVGRAEEKLAVEDAQEEPGRGHADAAGAPDDNDDVVVVVVDDDDGNNDDDDDGTKVEAGTPRACEFPCGYCEFGICAESWVVPAVLPGED